MLIVNGQLVIWGHDGRIIKDGALLVENDRIVDIGDTSDLLDRYQGQEVIDACGNLVMPGNICAHTHFYGAFARGLSIPGSPPVDFPEILQRLWWKLDQILTEEDVRFSALVCLVDAIKHGTTTLIDHHASAFHVEGSLGIIAEAVQQAGLRSVLCYEVSDRHGISYTKAGINENLRFIKSIGDGYLNDRLRAMFGLHASMSLSDATLEACAMAVPSGVGFHIHVAEHNADQENSLDRSGLPVVERLHRFGILGPDTIAAHCVYLSPAEIDIISETETWVTHQPRSNMNNGVGVAEVEQMLKKGVRVGLGNDGFSNNMWSEWKMTYLLHKVAHKDPRMVSGNAIVDMGVSNNADLASQLFNTAPVGVLEVGAYADIIIVDYEPTTPLTYGNLPWHIIFGFESGMVNTTICAGKVLMRDRQLLFLDEIEITQRSRELAAAAWKRFYNTE
ncbi:MAG TPA: putative aminohydrolase SsnA [Chloroflexi bacterium]|nr:putative aminohydrolase SsnA [Chloroflexota bacterium]|tara:strand:+ start:1473 stop:2816 length:1344 start_codon:yes stop_codon:yes gene_type:complete